MSNNLLAKENASIMRGLAIMAIMLHNLLHKRDFGFTQENESIYSQLRTDAFFNAITSLDTNLFGELLSFLGWIGVPVFVFLTGYGITRKYPPSSGNINTRSFLKHHYLKLFYLMLPGVLFFILFDIKTGAWTNVAKKIFALTMMSNLDYPHLRIDPGIYWYFGLTFQYYVFYCFAQKSLNNKALTVLSVLSILGYYLLGFLDSLYPLRVYKACLTGWFPLFAMGVWMAKDKIVIEIKRFPFWGELSLLVILSILLLMANMRYESWLFVPIIALLWFICLSLLVSRLIIFKKFFNWIGVYSAFIFVCHPIAREFYFKLNLTSINLFVSIALYISMTFAMAYCFRIVYLKIVRRFVND